MGDPLLPGLLARVLAILAIYAALFVVKGRRTRVGLLALAALLMAPLAFFVLLLNPEIFWESSPTRAELRPGVRVGADEFVRSEFVRCEVLGEVTDVAIGRVAGDGEIRLVLGGTHGLAICEPDSGRIVRSASFGHPKGYFGSECRVRDLDDDGQFEFVNLSGGEIALSVCDSSGKLLWRDGVSDTRAAIEDLDSDGKLEIVVTPRYGTGTRLFDCDGTLRWSRPWTAWLPAFFDVDGDGRKDILFAEDSAVRAVDSEGEDLTRLLLPAGGIANVVAVARTWGDPSRRSLVAGEYRGSGTDSVQHYYALGADLKSVGEPITIDSFEAQLHAEPLAFADSTAAWFELSTLRKPAPVVGIKATRLRLRLFDKAGATVYDEIIQPPDNERCATEGAAVFRPAEGDRPAQLYVAYGPATWRLRRR